MTMMGGGVPRRWRQAQGDVPGGLEGCVLLELSVMWADGRCSLCREAVSCQTSPSGVMARSLPHPGPFLFSVRLPLQASRPRAGTRAGHGRASWVMLQWVAPSRILVHSLLSKDFCLRSLLRTHSISIFFWGKGSGFE